MRVPPLLAVGLAVGALAGPAVASGAGFTGGGLTLTAARAPVGARVVSFAQKFKGVPYVFGANGPRSFDCSGFTSYVFRHFNITLPRNAYAQMHQGKRVTGALRPGDLVFWENGGHVGIYTGHDNFISATVHRGVWTYSLREWRHFQSYTTARRFLPGSTVPRRSRTATASSSFHGPRNGGPAAATPDARP
jgi:cell wall-associated NlpC family hydrolase